MRKLSDLITEEPVALTGFVAAVANVTMATGVDLSGELVASINVLIGAAFIALRWIVVSPATADAMVDEAHALGYDHAVADVRALDPTA